MALVVVVAVVAAAMVVVILMVLVFCPLFRFNVSLIAVTAMGYLINRLFRPEYSRCVSLIAVAVMDDLTIFTVAGTGTVVPPRLLFLPPVFSSLPPPFFLPLILFPPS
jgi:hypothetical protein